MVERIIFSPLVNKNQKSKKKERTFQERNTLIEKKGSRYGTHQAPEITGAVLDFLMRAIAVSDILSSS